MNSNTFLFIRNLTLSLILTIIFGINLLAQDKFSAGEILVKHLDSIGTSESRAAIKSTMVVGISKASFKGQGAGFADGIVVLASEGEKNLIGMKFNNADYPFEMMGYDGKDFSAKQIRPGTRTVLGDFLRLHESVFKNGMMGGALSQSWPLHKYDEKKGKAKFAGIQKIDDKQLYKLS